MKTVKKVLLVLLVLNVSLSFVFSGCKKDTGVTENTTIQEVTTEQTTAETTEDPAKAAMLEKTGGIELPLSQDNAKFTWMIMTEGDIEVNTDMMSLKKLVELTGVDIEFINVPSDNYDDKKNTMFAAGDIPDVAVVTLSDSKQLGAQLFTAVSDYFDTDCPNLKNIINNDMAFKMASIASDGKIYGFPSNSYTAGYPMDIGIIYRQDLFNKAGINDSPKTSDDFYAILKTVKEKYPDAVPLMNRAGYDGYGMFRFSSFFGTNGDPWDHVQIYDGKAVFCPATPEYKDMIEFANKLYSEKLFDERYVFTKTSEWQDAMLIGNGVVSFDYVTRAQDFDSKNANSEQPVEGYDMAIMTPFKSANTGKGWVNLGAFINTDTITAISKNAKNKEVILKFFDLLYSPMGTELTTFGIEGETFAVATDGGRYLLPDVNCTYNPDGTKDRKALGLGYNNITHYYSYNPEDKPDFYSEEITNYARAVRSAGMIGPAAVIMPSTPEEDEEYYTNFDLATELLVENIDKFVMGQRPLSEWEDFIKEFDKYNVNRLIEIKQAQYDRASK